MQVYDRMKSPEMESEMKNDKQSSPLSTDSEPLDFFKLAKKLWHQDATVDTGVYPVSGSSVLSEKEEKFWQNAVRLRTR